MATCKICKITGKLRYTNMCKSCYMKEYLKENRWKYREQEKRYRQRPEQKAKKLISNIKHAIKHPRAFKARRTLNKAIERDKIRKRNSCEICHSSPTHCHHDNYDKPLEYIELCTKCHSLLHQQYHEQGIKL